VAIAGFAEFMNLTYHSELLHFAMKWLKFDYFYLAFASFCQWMEIIGSFHRKKTVVAKPFCQQELVFPPFGK